MYFALYDRHLKTIGETYLLESWSRTQRALDFDDMKIVGEQIPYSADPFIVVINDRQGKLMFSGLASTPSVDEKSKKTTISLKDYTTLFNTDIFFGFGRRYSNVSEYIDDLLSAWIEQTDVGMENIQWDVSRIQSIPWETPQGSSYESFKLYEEILGILSYYGIYCIPELDIYRKTLTFRFYPAAVSSISVRLSDFGVTNIEKSFGEFNRVTVYNHLKERKQQWALTQDNRVVKIPASENSILVYPAKNRNFIAEEPSLELTEEQAIDSAVYDAVMSLAENRYQENFDLNAQAYKSVLDLTSLDFSYVVKVFTEEGEYKDLPVGEIETNSSGIHIVRIGHRIQELTQEL